MTQSPPEPTPAPPAGPDEGAPAQQHGDPLLASAQGRNDGDDGSRHGFDAAHPDERGDAPPA